MDPSQRWDHISEKVSAHQTYPSSHVNRSIGGEYLSGHVCKIREHWGCLESLQQDAILKCGHMDRHDIGTCAMQARAEGFVGITLVEMYAKCGSIEDAWRLFNNMPSWDVVTRTTMILRHVQCKQGQKALELFQQMQQEGVWPNSVTFVGVLNACANVVPSGEEGRCVHQQIIECAWDSYIFVVNSLVDLYAKCGSIKGAWRVFNKMPSQDVVTWNAMLGGCAMHGHDKEALKHFEQMCEGVQPDDIIFICLLPVCSHAGLVDEGVCCYASMVTDYMISVKLEHYTCMVNLLSCAGHLQEAENMVMAMPCKQHVAAWMVLLGTYRIHGNVEMAEHIAKWILEMEPDNATGYVLLSNTYAAAGNSHLHENVEWQRKEKRCEEIARLHLDWSE